MGEGWTGRPFEMALNGQTCEVDMSIASLGSLQTIVQEQLCLPSVAPLKIRDSNGRVLLSDEDLQQALDEGSVPLHASVASTSIKPKTCPGESPSVPDLMRVDQVWQDDVAQMQLRIMREQVSSCSQQVNSVVQLLYELKEDFREQKLTQQLLERRCQPGAGYPQASDFEALKVDVMDCREQLRLATSEIEAVTQTVRQEQLARAAIETIICNHSKNAESAKEMFKTEQSAREADSKAIWVLLSQDAQKEQKDPGLGMPAVDHAGHNFQTIAAHVDEQIADMRSLLIQQEMRAEESAAELRSHVASAVEELCQILDKNLSDGFGRWNNNLQDITRLSQKLSAMKHSGGSAVVWQGSPLSKPRMCVSPPKVSDDGGPLQGLGSGSSQSTLRSATGPGASGGASFGASTTPVPSSAKPSAYHPQPLTSQTPRSPPGGLAALRPTPSRGNSGTAPASPDVPAPDHQTKGSSSHRQQRSVDQPPHGRHVSTVVPNRVRAPSSATTKASGSAGEQPCIVSRTPPVQQRPGARPNSRSPPKVVYAIRSNGVMPQSPRSSIGGGT